VRPARVAGSTGTSSLARGQSPGYVTRRRLASPALFCVDRIEIEGALLLAFDSTIEAAACTYEPLMEPT
jgi:hypothetical protein